MISATERQVGEGEFDTIIVEKNERGTIIRTIATVHVPEYAEKFVNQAAEIERLMGVVKAILRKELSK